MILNINRFTVEEIVDRIKSKYILSYRLFEKNKINFQLVFTKYNEII